MPAKAPFRIAIVYFVVGTVWILVTDYLLLRLSLSLEQLSRLQTLKGGIYVVITAVLAWILVRRHAFQQLRIQQELREQRDTAQKTLREREALIGEIHHRVRNILQIVLSIIGLSSQAKAGEHAESDAPGERDTSSAPSLTASQQIGRITERVSAIALVHDHVLTSRNVEAVDCSRYIPALVNSVRPRFYRPNVEVTHRVAEIMLSLEVAVPCGLVINELLINALTHGFPPDGEGSVSVTMEADADNPNEVVITVLDDGVGIGTQFAASARAANEAVGLLIAEAMALQISAELHVAPRQDSPGTEATLRFKPLDNATSEA